ncbi:MAG: hypothetical protein MI867_12435 [Pseudomonadales bacterium]|nr:hypothetical protein [Pseudomonadales bacterium]
MANTELPIIGFPNHLDSTFTDSGYSQPVISGGSFETTRPRTNLKDDLFVNVARTTDATAASTFMHFDLGITRDVKMFAIPSHNCSRTATYRLRGSDTVAWSGVTVNGVNALNATTLNVSTTDAISVSVGEGFTIAGDTQLYQATAAVSIGASSTGSISIERVDATGTGLASATTGSEVITCHAGDFTTTVVDTGSLDVWEVIYEQYTLYYGHPSLADGKIEPHNLPNRRSPIVYINSTDGVVDIARYWRLDIADTSNADGYIELSRAFFCPGYEATKAIKYNMSIGRFSNSTLSKSKGGANIPNDQRGGKKFVIGIDNIPESEGMGIIYDMVEDADVTKQIFFVMNKKDTVHKHRRMFTARLKKLDPLTIPFFEKMDAVFEVEEVVA